MAAPPLPGNVDLVKDASPQKHKHGPRPEKSERRKSFELALERGSSQELLQTQPEGTKEAKGDFQVTCCSPLLSQRSRLRQSKSQRPAFKVTAASVMC